jgi:Flp pilus assembly protein TadG
MTSSSTHSRFKRRILELARDERGISAIVVALLTASLIGVVGMGVEAGLWFTDARGLQTQADAAAFAGAIDLAQKLNNSSIGSSATLDTSCPSGHAAKEATNNGFADGCSNVSITELTTGSYSTTSPAVRVILTSPKTPRFLSVFSSAAVNISATSIVQVQSAGSPCVLALDSASTTDITIQGSTSVTASNCVLASDASGSASISVQDSGAVVTATNMYAVGDVSLHSLTNLVTSPAGQSPMTGQPSIPNPFSTTTVTTPSGSCSTNTTPTTPGYYCDINYFNISGVTTLAAGVYYVSSAGNFHVKKADVEGTGVTIVLLSSGGTAGQFNFDSNATVKLSAPLTTDSPAPTFPGFVLIQDPNTTPGTTAMSFSGGPTVQLSGAVYMPHGDATFQGTPTTTRLTNCLVVVAYQLTLSGNSTLGDSCPGTGLNLPNVNQVRLVM